MIASEAEIRVFLGVSDSATDEERAVLTMVHPRAEARVREHIGYDPEQSVRTEYYPRHQPAGGLGIRETSGVWDVNAAHTFGRFEPATSHINRTLQLEGLPVRTITSVHVDYDGRHGKGSGAFGSGDLQTDGDDFWAEFDEDDVCRSGMLFASGAWTIVPGSVKVVYRSGYSQEELSGRAVASSVASDGTITTARLDGSGIKRAVILTAVKAFQTWAALKKRTAVGFVPGPFSGEKLGDYSYSLFGIAESIAGLIVELPGEARDALQAYRHYGIMRL